LAQLTPTPLAVIRFMNPVLAASSVPDEPADLEIRVYSVGQATSLEDWLTVNGLAPAGGSPHQPFQTSHVSGVQVCSDTMIAPGCAFFVRGGGWVYQLIPSSVTGEEMINTFQSIP
jgi:hypothetical protein